MNRVDVQKMDEEFDNDAYIDFLVHKNIDEFLSGTLEKELHIFTKEIYKYAYLPTAGSHLIVQKIGYTHHGIYIGDEKVIHYAGYGNDINLMDTLPNHSTNRSPVEEVTLREFTKGAQFTIEEHPYSTYSPEIIVERAYSRIQETKYNLLFNNCEHFAEWCIYGKSDSKQIKSLGLGIAKAHPIANTTMSVYHFKEVVTAYLHGDITGEKLMNEISHQITVSGSALVYSLLGQAMIPIPILGMFIGGLIGGMLGNILYCSHHFTLIGDTTAIKQAKERREKVERICNAMIPIIRESRKRLDIFLSQYFSDRKIIFNEAFDLLDDAINSSNMDDSIAALEKINQAFGKKLTYNKFDSFDNFMKS